MEFVTLCHLTRGWLKKTNLSYFRGKNYISVLVNIHYSKKLHNMGCHLKVNDMKNFIFNMFETYQI